jgi:hypothetical protein
MRILATFLALAAIGCGQPDASPPVDAPFTGPFDRELQFEIGAHRVPCEGVEKFFCMLVREGGGEWQLSYDGIHGLTPAWGIHYLIRVGVRTIANPPADGSSLEYHLRELIEQRPVAAGTTFSFDIDRDLVEASGGRFSLRFEHDFTCTPALCADLLQRLESAAPFRMTLEHPVRPADPLRLTAVANAARMP